MNALTERAVCNTAVGHSGGLLYYITVDGAASMTKRLQWSCLE